MSVDTYPMSVLNAQLWNGQSMPLSIAGGGTGATTAASARTALELGTMATQNANAVAITGGALSGMEAVEAQRFWTTAGTVQPKLVAQDITGGGGGSGLSSFVTAGTGRWNVYASGSAPNHFTGGVGIGTEAIGTNKLAVQGTAYVSGGIGLGTGPVGHAITLTYNRAALHGILITPSADTGTGCALFFTNAANTVSVGSISTTATATAYNTSSDVRLKHAVATLTDALARVQALRPVSFRWNADDSTGHGFLAHELQQVIPEAVTGEPEALNEDGSIKPQQVDHSKLVPWLVKAIQELSARVEALEGAIL